MLPPSESAFCKIQSLSQDHLQLIFGGQWLIREQRPNWQNFLPELVKLDHGLKKISFKVEGLGAWDSGLLIFLTQCQDFCKEHNIQMVSETLPRGLVKILELSQTGTQGVDIPIHGKAIGFFARAGELSINFYKEAREQIVFVGEITLSFLNLLIGKAMMRIRDLMYLIQTSGFEALPIVSLIAFLVGVIMAFVGAIQLRQFGADIYVANLVGLAMVREMGAVMTAVIMTGRTGAAFAAHLGTMKVTEEIDALKTLGISTIDFLVLPRMLALFLMMPLLTIYADFVGMFGGFVVSMSMLDISYVQYINQTREAVNMTHFSVGVIKSFVFGLIVAFTGCFKGIKCGSNASAIGDAATQAVVYGVTYMVIADAIFTFIFDILNI